MEPLLILIAFVAFIVLGLWLKSPGFVAFVLVAGLVAGVGKARDVGADMGWWGASSASMVKQAENASEFSHIIWVDRNADDIRIDATFINNSPFWVKGVSVECRAELESGWTPLSANAPNVVIAPGGSFKLSRSGGDGRSVYVTGSECQAHYAEASTEAF